MTTWHIIISLILSVCIVGLLNLIPARVMKGEWKVVMNVAAAGLTIFWVSKVI